MILVGTRPVRKVSIICARDQGHIQILYISLLEYTFVTQIKVLSTAMFELFSAAAKRDYETHNHFYAVLCVKQTTSCTLILHISAELIRVKKKTVSSHVGTVLCNTLSTQDFQKIALLLDPSSESSGGTYSLYSVSSVFFQVP